MVKFVEEKAKYLVKVALRDGEPIFHVAEWLGKRGLAKTNDWRTAWLTREVINNYVGQYRYDEDKVVTKECSEKYFKQEGLLKPFTLVDTGFVGTAPRKLQEKNPRHRVQTLFMVNDDESQDVGIESLWRNKCLQHYHLPYIKLGKIFCEEILEKVPKKYKRLEYKNGFIQENDIWKPNVESACNDELLLNEMFLKGVENGLEHCSTKVVELKNIVPAIERNLWQMRAVLSRTKQVGFSDKEISKSIKEVKTCIEKAV